MLVKNPWTYTKSWHSEFLFMMIDVCQVLDQSWFWYTVQRFHNFENSLGWHVQFRGWWYVKASFQRRCGLPIGLRQVPCVRPGRFQRCSERNNKHLRKSLRCRYLFCIDCRLFVSIVLRNESTLVLVTYSVGVFDSFNETWAKYASAPFDTIFFNNLTCSFFIRSRSSAAWGAANGF